MPLELVIDYILHDFEMAGMTICTDNPCFVFHMIIIVLWQWKL